ncbi:MAG: glycosyltransferase [Bacteroidota bacterium]|nr:glycosyltransferase [Bacteroidota bacterium]
MRILHILYSLTSGGVQRFVVDLCNELSAKGHEVHLCVMLDDRIDGFGFFVRDISPAVHYQNLRIPSGFRLSNIFRFYKVIREIKPDIVHCHLNLVNYVFPLTYRFRKMAFFQTIHNDAPREVTNKVEYRLRRFFYKNGKVRPITISEESTRSFVEYYRTDQYTEIYNGGHKPVESEEFGEVKRSFEKLREDRKMIFLHVARFAAQKNQEMLIRTFNRLIQENFPVALLVIGSDFDSPKGKELQGKAMKGIWFLGEKHNIADYYLNADAFCLTSIFEGMPITLIESFACGCIPICTPVGGIINTIHHRVNGFISPSVSEEDYYNTVLEFIKFGDQIHKKDLTDFFKEKLSMEACAQKHISEYHKSVS